MAKLYKVRKKCMICGNVFYPRYAGSLYCETCKNKTKEVSKPKPAKKKTVQKAKKTVKASKAKPKKAKK